MRIPLDQDGEPEDLGTCDRCHRRAQLMTDDAKTFLCWPCAEQHPEWEAESTRPLREQREAYKRGKDSIA